MQAVCDEVEVIAPTGSHCVSEKTMFSIIVQFGATSVHANFSICLTFFLSLLIAEVFELRLVNGSDLHPSVGRLEIKYEGVWGTICDDFFDKNSAAVACRMLGFGGALAVYPRGQLSQGSDSQPIWLDDVSCPTGNEATFTECGHSQFGINNCIHGEDVGIGCYSKWSYWHRLFCISSSLACTYIG